jgi:branched-chain amino acid transport system ATP-binding protein
MLELKNVEVIYDDVILVLKGLSLSVAEGKIVALLGSNGAGKSTTLKAISGLLRSEEGEVTDGGIFFQGQPMHELPPEAVVRRGIFQVMEGRRVFEDLTVDENIDMGGYTRNDRAGLRADKEACYELFPRLKERRKKLAGYLSGGEQQMLAISRALMARPKLMMLDEPSLGLAPLLVAEIFRIIKRINEERKTTILLVEQNANLALSIADYGYIMENGRVVLDGEPDKLRANEDVKEFYLGGGGEGGKKSYKDLKSYKRRKRWLS